MFLFWDYIILIVSVLFWIIWIFLWTKTLYKIYFWMIFGFLLFLVFNLQIELLELKRPEKLSVIEDFVMKNKGFCLSSAAISIFLIWLSFAIWLRNKSSNMISSFVLGFFLFIFYIGLNSYIIKNSFIELTFLRDIFSFVSSSYIFIFFTNKPHYIFIMMIFVLFWKIINLLLIWFWAYLMEVIRNLFWDSNNKQVEDEKWNSDEEPKKNNLLW